jgi:Taurine catabolism dioxygenase TauD, TfdA family
MDLNRASVVPRRVVDAAEARAAVASEGAAIMIGLPDQDAAISSGAAMLGADCLRIGTQFEATKDRGEMEAAVVAEQPADERGRKRRLTATAERMAAHNDGYGFGDFAPDYLFLWCERPDPDGGDSFLVDGLKLLEILAAEPGYEDLVSFCWNTDIDQSEPNFPQTAFAPIARRLPGGRVQVRHHPFLAPVPGPDEERHRPFVERWSELVTTARDAGPMFRLAAGEMICIDNYRMTHGRDSFADPARRVLSIWGWSADAVAVPDGPLDIVRPTVPPSAGSLTA